MSLDSGFAFQAPGCDLPLLPSTPHLPLATLS